MLFWDYFEAHADKKNVTLYDYVINPPIILGNLQDSTPVIEVIPPPELHLLVDQVNNLYNELEQIWTQNQKWLKACNAK